MLFERRFEEQTKGLVCGPSVLETNAAAFVPVLPAKRELFILGEPKLLQFGDRGLHYKVSIRAIEGGEEIWVRPFATKDEALFAYVNLIGIDLDRVGQREIHLPSVWQSGELEYAFATVVTFNSSVNNSGLDWNNGGSACPGGVNAVDYVLVGGGGASSANAGTGLDGSPGAGAGGYLSGSGTAVTAGTNYPVVIGAGGTGGTTSGAVGSDGADSTWNSLTALKGAHSPVSSGANPGVGGNGTYGSGSGSHNSSTSGAGTTGQGSAGGTTTDGDSTAGGGGSSSAGASSPGANNGAAGGNGTASSITGSSVTRATGGGGGAYDGGTGGTGGSSNANNNSGRNARTNAVNATANTGSGAGGCGGGNPGSGFWKGGNGGSGVLILSFTATIVVFRQIRRFVRIQ